MMLHRPRHARVRPSRGRLCPWVLVALAAVSCGGEPDRPPDLLLVSIDTLRADALSCYGNPRETTPGIDELARAALLFEEVWADSPSTGPSHASLFTGLPTGVHRVATTLAATRGDPSLRPGFTTLAEELRAAGYRTVAITDGGAVGAGLALLQGFEVVDAQLEGVQKKVERALAELAVDDGRPLFLFLHTYQVHMPYTAPEDWGRRFDPDYEGILRQTDGRIRARVRRTGRADGLDLLRHRGLFEPRDVQHLQALYHGELLYTDHQLQRVWDALRADGRLDDTLLVITSDHGEQFGEHGRFGHGGMTPEELLVPLILRWPGRVEPGRESRAVAHIDLHATLLDLLDIGTGERHERSLVRPLSPAPIVSEDVKHLYVDRRVPWARTVRDGTWALTSERFVDEERVMLHDTSADPRQRVPVVDETRPVGAPTFDSGPWPAAARLDALLRSRHAHDDELRRALLGPGASPTWEADTRTREELDALGYGGGEEDR